MRRITLWLALAAALSCQDRTADPVAFEEAGSVAFARGGIPMHAVVEFGTEAGSVGTDFDPGSGHDRSFHAGDKIRPRTVVIQAGGSVTFEVYPLHQVAVYAPGVRPEDVDATETEPIPVLPFLTRITDDTNRLVLGPEQAFAVYEWTTPAGTFDEPGTYLVICTTTVHFVDAGMYAWVIVQ